MFEMRVIMSLPHPQPRVPYSLNTNRDPKTHKRLEERFLFERNRTKRVHFRGSPLFQATYNIKTEKQTMNLTYLV